MTRSLILAALLVSACLPAAARAAGPHLDVDLNVYRPPVGASLDASPDDEMSVEDRRAMQERLKVRRQLLQIHQGFSFAAVGSIIAADIVGMFNHEALDSGVPVRSELEGSLALHRAHTHRRQPCLDCAVQR